MEKIRNYGTKVYLENLRRSGEVNMFAAAAYLVRDCGMSAEEAVTELTEWMKNYDLTDYRICDKCEKAMDSGFVIGDGLAYYCSEACLHQDYTEAEYQEMYETDNGYYTEWDE